MDFVRLHPPATHAMASACDVSLLDREAFWLAAVVTIHAILLATALFSAGGERMTTPAKPPAIVGMLLSAPTTAAEPHPEPRPHRVPAAAETVRIPPKPVTNPPPRPAAKPMPVVPTSTAEAPTRHQPEAQVNESAAPSSPTSAQPVVTAAQAAAPATRAQEVSESLPIVPPRTDAAHLNNPPPEYPRLSRRVGEQGRVLLDVYILPDGSVGQIKLRQTSGYERLDKAAMEAVRNWRYVPAHRGGEPIAYWYVQPIHFSLDN